MMAVISCRRGSSKSFSSGTTLPSPSASGLPTLSRTTVSGEASGDLLASHLIQALRAKLPNAQFYGIGGPKMIGQGFDAWYPLEKLAVRGYVEVLKHYRQQKGY